MKRVALLMAGAASLSLAACKDNAADVDATSTDTATTAADTSLTSPVGTTGATTAAASTWPKDARIVDENGVTYRVDASGNRVRLGDTDAKIVVDDGVRYRVDPGGARIRLDERGLGVDVDPPSVRATGTTPGIEVRTN